MQNETCAKVFYLHHIYLIAALIVWQRNHETLTVTSPLLASFTRLSDAFHHQSVTLDQLGS